MERTKFSVDFTADDESEAIDLYTRGVILGIKTPASFGVTAISFLHSDTESGTYVPVNDEGGNLIEITVSDTAAGLADLTNIFPAAIGRISGPGKGFVKLKVGSNITKTVQVYTGL